MSSPKDAAAVILVRQDTDPNNPEVYWVKRSDNLAFLGGFHAFPGGQIDARELTRLSRLPAVAESGSKARATP